MLAKRRRDRAAWVERCRDRVGRRGQVTVEPLGDGRRLALVVPADGVAVLDLLAIGRLRRALRIAALELHLPDGEHRVHEMAGRTENTVDATLFTLVTADDPSQVFAFGIRVRNNDGTEEAVTYRRDPRTGHVLHGVHVSAEAACRRFSTIVPLVLLPQDEENPPTSDRAARHDLAAWRRSCRGRRRISGEHPG